MRTSRILAALLFVVLFGSCGDDEPNLLPIATIQTISFPENSEAGTQIATVTASDQDGEIQAITTTDNRISISGNSIILAQAAAFDFEDTEDNEISIQVEDDSGAIVTVEATTQETDVNEETTEEVTESDYVTQTIFDEETAFKIGTVRLRRVYQDQDKKPEELESEEIIEVISEDYTEWVKAAAADFDGRGEPAVLARIETMEALASHNPDKMKAERDPTQNFQQDDDHQLIMTVPNPHDRFFGGSGSARLSEFEGIKLGLGLIFRPVQKEVRDLDDMGEIDIPWLQLNYNMFFHSGSARLQKVMSDGLVEISELPNEAIEDRTMAYKVIGYWIVPKVKGLFSN